MNYAHMWTDTCAVFRDEVSDDVADLWLTQLRPVGSTRTNLFVTGSERVRSWIELRYGRALSACAAKAAGCQIVVELVDEFFVPTDDAGTGNPDSETHCTAFNARFTFENFVIGRSNQMGHAAALSVAESPGQTFNPLFIYGDPGVGKTHLLHSIGNFLSRQAPEIAVRYMTAEEFASAYRDTLRAGSIADFKSSLRQTEVLLIDDVQFLQNKAKTEEEFFHTFNVLHESGRQLVITCDRTPRKLEALATRLRERFESGFVVEIEPPEPRLRLAILRKRVQTDQVPLSDDLAIERIAERVPPNVRSLEGALVRVGAYASMRREPVTSALVDELLAPLYPDVRAETTITDVIAVVCEYYDVPENQLLSAARDRSITVPRQVAMYLCCEMTSSSLPAIAAAFGRDHSTVVYARDKLTAALPTDDSLAAAVGRLRRIIHRDAGDPAAA